MNPEKLIVFLNEALEFYQKERLILHQGKPEAFLELLPEKQTLEERMKDTLEKIKGSSLFNLFNDQAKTLIKTLLQTIQALTQENQLLIENISDKYNRLFHRLCHLSQKSEQKMPTPYSAMGTLHRPLYDRHKNSQHLISYRM